MKLPPDFRDLLAEFARERVEHAIIGGYAFAYHAEPRATKDLDLLVRGHPANLDRAARALARYGAPAQVVDGVRHLGLDEVAYFGESPLRVDILRSVDGVDTDSVIDRAEAATWCVSIYDAAVVAGERARDPPAGCSNESQR